MVIALRCRLAPFGPFFPHEADDPGRHGGVGQRSIPAHTGEARAAASVSSTPSGLSPPTRKPGRSPVAHDDRPHLVEEDGSPRGSRHRFVRSRKCAIFDGQKCAIFSGR